MDLTLPYAIALLLWLACLAGAKRGGGGDWRKAQTGKGKGARPFPLFPIPPLPFPLPSNPLPLLTPATQATLWRIPLLEVFYLSVTVCKIRYTHSLIIPDYFVGSSAVEKLKSTVLFSNCLSNNSRILR